MRRWSEVAERVAATTRTSEKTGLLAEYLPTLTPEELPMAAVFLTGRPFAETDQRATGIGWATIALAVGAVVARRATRGSGSERQPGPDGGPVDARAALGTAYDRFSDLGLAVEAVLAEAGGEPDPAASPGLSEVARAFAEIESASGPARKAAILAGLLDRCDPRTAKGVVKILSGDLRIGLREGLVEAAIAAAFDRPLDAVKRAGMLTGDIGRTAVLAAANALASATLTIFHPLKFMLASPAEDAAEILARLGPDVWVEDKYDGIRCQLHKVAADVRLYSRDLHDVSGQFPEIVAAARDLPWDGILDGEILGWRDGGVLPFVALQARLGRRDPGAAILAEVPVIYVAFDALGLGPGGGAAGGVAGGAAGGRAPVEPLLDVPLADRRRRLEALGLPALSGFALSHLTSATSVDALEVAFSEARGRRNEGLMVKDPRSRYSPGRRGYGWLKMKKALATIDCVVVGVEVGHGKRHGVLSDYTFAVRDQANDRLVTIGKAYSGLTDAEIAEMTRWFEAHTISVHGRYRVVEPTVVVEIAFDVILRSARHRSGFALRFPRIARLRLDKPADQADTLETVRRLFEGLQPDAARLITAEARASDR